MEKLTLRQAQPTDLPDVLAMVQALARHHGDDPKASVDTLARDLFGQDRWAWALVASLGPKLVGYALLAPLLRAHFGQRGLDLHHLYVDSPARGQGVGRALIVAARDLAQAMGASYLSVGTHPDNHAAAHTYLACGFTPVPVAGLRFTMGTQPPRVG